MQKIDRIDDWAASVDNRAAVPAHEEHFLNWGRRAAAFRAHTPPQTLSYGESERETFDLWMPEGAPKGLVVFLHGGWWMNFDRSYFSNLAGGPLTKGWAVAVPSYTLLPNISLTGLVAQARGAVETIAATVPDVPLVVSGHSAGGHLSAMCGVPGALNEATRARLARIVSISGVHDLRPLLGLPVNDVLGITEDEAQALSPALLRPDGDFELVAWAGAEETPEFRRQNALLGVAWGGYVTTHTGEAVVQDHFTVINPLEDPNSAITGLLVGG